MTKTLQVSFKLTPIVGTAQNLVVYTNSEASYRGQILSGTETEQAFEAVHKCLLTALYIVRRRDFDDVEVWCNNAIVAGTLKDHWTMTPKLFQYAKNSIQTIGKIKTLGLTVRLL